LFHQEEEEQQEQEQQQEQQQQQQQSGYKSRTSTTCSRLKILTKDVCSGKGLNIWLEN
jgi:type II secretory pathway pseudopilin PulG